MLAKFRVSNFKNFGENFELDFTKVNKYDFNKECIKNDLINNAIIYGKNGVGKSNLGFAIFDIIGHLTDKNNNEENYRNYINAYSNDNLAHFYYEFHINDYKIIYEYKKTDNKSIEYEKFSIDNNILASIDRKKSNIATINFKGTETLNKNLENNTEISVLKYIQSNSVLEKNNINDTFSNFMNFVDRMLFFRSLKQNEYIGLETGSTNLEEDLISKNLIPDFELFLNKAGIECKLKVIRTVGERQLFFDFDKKQIRFLDIASQGTISLVLFYFWLQKIKEKNKVSFLFIDEFDAFYHHELSKLIVEELKNTGVQFVLTTHNTSIMNKEEIKSLPNATVKELREGHNLEKIYKADGFDF